jgi:hypothetical protein
MEIRTNAKEKRIMKLSLLSLICFIIGYFTGQIDTDSFFLNNLFIAILIGLIVAKVIRKQKENKK